MNIFVSNNRLVTLREKLLSNVIRSEVQSSPSRVWMREFALPEPLCSPNAGFVAVHCLLFVAVDDYLRSTLRIVYWSIDSFVRSCRCCLAEEKRRERWFEHDRLFSVPAYFCSFPVCWWEHAYFADTPHTSPRAEWSVDPWQRIEDVVDEVGSVCRYVTGMPPNRSSSLRKDQAIPRALDWEMNACSDHGARWNDLCAKKSLRTKQKMSFIILKLCVIIREVSRGERKSETQHRWFRSLNLC